MAPLDKNCFLKGEEAVIHGRLSAVCVSNIVIANEQSECGNPGKLSTNVNATTILDHQSRNYIPTL